MELNIENTNGMKSITLHAGERLDLTSFGKFAEAATIANNHSIDSIVVNFERTRQLLDSGASMLLFLYSICDQLKDRIYLVNVRPEIRYKLIQDNFPFLSGIDGSVKDISKLPDRMTRTSTVST